MSLTDTECKAAKGRAKPYKLFDGQGLYLEVMPNGRKYWRWKFRINGKEKRLALGVYDAVTLKEARILLEAQRQILRVGKDPALVKKITKQSAKYATEHTFEVVGREWHQHNIKRWGEQHAADILHRIEKDLFPDLGAFPIDTIMPMQVSRTILNIQKRGANEVARRSLQYASRVFRYGVSTGRLPSDPTRDLRGSLQPYKTSHYKALDSRDLHKALDSRDLPSFLQALRQNDARIYPQTIRSVRLLIMTFVRTSELIAARWSEFDLEKAEWHIPAERMKIRKPHIVPLSRQVLALLEEQMKFRNEWDWVFPSIAGGAKHMSNGTILKVIRSIGFDGKTTGHGFRALAMSTIKEELGWRHEVVDRQLAHEPRTTNDKAYDRAAFLPERKLMMQAWSDYVEGSENRRPATVYEFSPHVGYDARAMGEGRINRNPSACV